MITVLALEEETVATTLFGLFLGEGLEGGVDGGDGEEDTGTRADGTHKVSSDGESTDAETTEGGGGGDVAVEVGDGGFVTVTFDHHVLVLELFGDVLGGGAGDVDPGLGEEGARAEDEDDVDEGVEGISADFAEGGGRRDVVRNTRHWDRLSLVVRVLLPRSQQSHHRVREVLVQQLREEEQIRHQRRLQNNRNIRRVEQLDRIRSHRSLRSLRRNRDIHAESLEINHRTEHQNRRQQIRHVRQSSSVKRLLQRTRLILSRHQQMEHRNHCSFILRSSWASARHRRKGLPDDRLADVRRNKQRNRTSQSVSLLQQLIQQDHQDTGNKQLNHNQHRVDSQL